MNSESDFGSKPTGHEVANEYALQEISSELVQRNIIYPCSCDRVW